MLDDSFDITSIALALNERAVRHPIGGLQSIRKTLRNFDRLPSKSIFTSQTIHPHWAFHHGGRSELQFNIGLENFGDGDELRYGVAFSFELSQTLPTIDVLIPKARRFNDYLQMYPDHFADMRMWHHRDATKSGEYSPSSILPESAVPGVFVFLGKRQPLNDIDLESILTLFDRLLPLYEYVESGREQLSENGSQEFEFRPGTTEKSPLARASLAERELNITLKHNILQSALSARLSATYGAENVADEHPSGLGTKIDVVLRRSADDEYWYYEIKTASSPRACLREALGQILEYSYWPGAHEAKKLIICGENMLDDDGAAYLRRLQTRFGLPIDYEQISLDR